MNRPFEQEVQGRIVAKIGELTAQNIELGAAMDAMGERQSAVQSFLNGLVASAAVAWLNGQL